MTRTRTLLLMATVYMALLAVLWVAGLLGPG
jgi:hypothetical protein